MEIMAATDLSKTFDELESDELSLETSVPTDLTLSPEREIHDHDRTDRKTKISKQLIERKQLLHDIQLLKIEISQKNLTLESMKAESLKKVDELEEQLHEALHQKQILTARLESQLQIQEQEARRRQELIKEELEEVRSKQRQLEATNEKLQEKAGNVRKSLMNLDITEDRYYEIRGLTSEESSLQDYVAMRLFEAVRPVQTEAEQLRLRNNTLEEEVRILSQKELELQQKLSEERQAHGELRVQFQKLNIDYTDTKERDNLEHDRMDIQRQLTVLEGAHQTLQKERDDLYKDLTAAKQSLTLLKQDKEYLTRQVADLSHRTTFAEEKVQELNIKVDDAKRSREEMYEKYVSSRDQYKTEYENKLREELEQVRAKTNAEIDRLRTSTKELYERENRNLREARDMAISERERAQASERETNTKYEQLLNEQIQMTGDNRLTELQNEVKLKGFESERTQMIHEETVRNLKESQLEVEKLQKKNEVLTKEYYSLQANLEKKTTELESVISEKKAKLDTYERMEKELDDIVMQAAGVEDEEEAEKVIFSYGYGANVPSNAKRRLQQSVHLARRVLQLEKINTGCRQDLERERNKIKQLAEELKNSNSLLDQAQQPYNYLIESIRQRDGQLQKQREYIESLETDVRRLEKERNDMVKTKNQMSLDLERLLNQKEEMSVMKQVVLNLSTRRHGDKKTQARDLAKPKSASVHVPHNTFEPHDDPNVLKPGSISLTRERPQWAEKLKNKGTSQKTKYSQKLK
ncbi:hypothetical protein KUTeg_024341, partial [Tegillarca granosa]